MDQKIRIDGIYDQRTLKHLRKEGLKEFCFDFSPRSFNFIQEHIFLDQLIPELDENDKIFLHFSRSNDPMVTKLAADLKGRGRKLDQVYFEFDEWSADHPASTFPFNYLLNFSSQGDLKLIGENFKGFIFDFAHLENLYHKNIIPAFVSNFYTRFAKTMSDNHFLILKIDWDQNIIRSIVDLFEFNVVSISINSKIEICYRNVDLTKLNNEMAFLKKHVQANLDF